jgi:hypothetical protein
LKKSGAKNFFDSGPEALKRHNRMTFKKLPTDFVVLARIKAAG